MDYLFQTNQNFNLDKLLTECSTFSITGFSTNTGQIVVHSLQELTAQELLQLEAIISQHNPVDQQALIRAVVENAVKFGNDLIISFATENVIMGITQAGKTKAVADYLADMMRYAQSGSLYEVMAEVDRLIASGIPQDLAPFVTETRLTQFKQKVLTYLNG